MKKSVKIVLVDDHEIVRNGIKLLLDDEEDLDVVGEASNGEEAIASVQTYQPDVVIMDIRMPLMNGIDATRKIKELQQEIKVLILSMHDDGEYIIKSVEEGADGYLLKDSSKPEFLKAIHTVSSGQKYFSGDISNTLVNSYLNAKGKASDQESLRISDSYHLTRREREILKLIYEGIPNKEIANQLEKSVRTIETHRFNIMKKLKVNNIAELMKKVGMEKELILNN
ncbi:MAG: response regulator transcription factor [Cyclobacteriaceae bacterium]|nr:response regulator transcription factor [Cyclobacteriaceae bacterium HetDA_MAG_MS6]